MRALRKTTILITSLLIFYQCTPNEKSKLQIGSILPLTGNAAEYGKSAQRGIDLAILEFNLQNNDSIEVIYEDSQADPKFGVNAINKLISVNKVKCIIGAMASSVTLGITPIAERNKVVLISPGSSAPEITNSGNYIFRTAYSDRYEGKVIAKYAFNELNIKSYGILFINNAYGIGLAEEFEHTINSLGGNVLIKESFLENSINFRSELNLIKEKKPEAILLLGYRELGQILKQSKELAIKSQFLSSIMFENPEILNIAGNAAENVLYSYPAYNPESKNEAVSSFVSSFSKEYDLIPDIYAALSYDAAKIILNSLSICNLQESDCMVNYLYELKNFPGVTGFTSFDKNGDVVKELGIKTVEDGEFNWLEERY